ncbi:MAG TPA: N-acetylmannosamine-6-phosphate 2-epimerase [Chloroflexia bacterium]|nr:N-acetylmannosamine-6-phosphate 2-epimerase [Chloroflexia bacterium]
MPGKPLDLQTLLNQVHQRLIVSCQALPEEPLFGSEVMVKMVKAALEGGGAGIRANSPADVAAIRKAFPNVPLIGLYKHDLEGFEVRITPTLRHALELAEAGCDIIALDATLRPHPEGSAADLIRQVKEHTGLPVLADISTLEEGLAAEEAGADLVGPTLSGYTAYSPQQEEPDFALLKALVARVKIPVIAEGRIATPLQARQALELGAYSVVVGSAITRPQWITRQFVKGIEGL